MAPSLKISGILCAAVPITVSADQAIQIRNSFRYARLVFLTFIRIIADNVHLRFKLYAKLLEHALLHQRAQRKYICRPGIAGVNEKACMQA